MRSDNQANNYLIVSENYNAIINCYIDNSVFGYNSEIDTDYIDNINYFNKGDALTGLSTNIWEFNGYPMLKNTGGQENDYTVVDIDISIFNSGNFNVLTLYNLSQFFVAYAPYDMVYANIIWSELTDSEIELKANGDIIVFSEITEKNLSYSIG